MLPRNARLVALLLPLLAACSDNLAVVGGLLDATLDTPDADAVVAPDRPVAPDQPVAPDLPPSMDAPADVAPDVARDAPGTCATDMDCAATPMTPACDTATHLCVACVPSNDRCSRGTYCDATAMRCVPGCRNDDDCTVAVTDGGVPTLHCNVMTRTCLPCVTNDHCAPGTLCVGSTCVAGCTATRPCPTGQTCCGDACIDPQSNVAHCGGCDMRCTVPNAAPACMNGNCTVGTCMGLFADCDGSAANGCETNPQTDLRHCGGCGMACATRANSSATCAAGRCAYTCDMGFADCDGDATNGCETDTRTSTTHCGACGRGCSLANATAACTAGACAIGSCNAGFADCDGNANNGCETDTRTSVSACGMCGRACPTPPNTVPACVGAMCAVTCAAGFGECNGVAMDGCEVTFATSVDHCGSCGRSCRGPNVATAECTTGTCRIVTCDAGFADCDGNAANGCETDTRVSTTHCGRCGGMCSAPGGTAVCRVGVCGVGSCATGLGDCDGNAANGCETSITTSLDHCGGCGMACAPANATGRCDSGRCAIAACATGFADCDMVAANGCEVDTRTSTGNCAMCGRMCSFDNAAASCAASACVMGACSAGFGDCNTSATDGCETATTTSTTHCGACGRACTVANATPACVGGTCTIGSCNTGFADCNTSAGDGCETNINTSNTSCGACGRACSVGTSCTAGTCTALPSCAAILAASPTAASGTYAIDPDGPGGAAAFNAYCDMASDGGGWTLIMMAASSPASTFGYDATAWTDTSTLNPTVTDPSMNLSVKSPAFNTLGFTAVRLCLGSLTACLNEPVTSASARTLFGGAERLGARTISDFRTWGYAGTLGCNRIGFNVYDIGGGTGARARCRYGILLNNEGTCEGSVDGGRGLGCRGYYGTQISAGQGDGIVATSHERGWIFVR